jgi:pimeloyl-ACP methyl ester carboxylesterase
VGDLAGAGAELTVLRLRRFAEPETRHVESGGVAIGYQVAGNGAPDVVVSPPLVSTIARAWRGPWNETVFRHVAERHRLVIYDKRGMGTSDRTVPPAALELALEDMRTVMDAAGSDRAVIFSISEGAPLALLFAATFPERTLGLILFGGSARVLEAPDYPWGRAPEAGPPALQALRHVFEGPRRQAAELIAWIGNLSPKDRRRFVDGIRASSDFATAEASVLLARSVDVRSVLPDLDVPTLLIHGQADMQIPIGAARYLKEQIRGSQLLELPGERHLPTGPALARALDEIDDFLARIAISEAARGPTGTREVRGRAG